MFYDEIKCSRKQSSFISFPHQKRYNEYENHLKVGEKMLSEKELLNIIDKKEKVDVEFKEA